MLRYLFEIREKVLRNFLETQKQHQQLLPMLLIDNYSLQQNKRPNYALLAPITPDSLTISYRTLILPTQSPDNFAHLTP